MSWGLAQGRRSMDEEWNGGGERMGRAGNWMDEDFPGAGRQLPTLSESGARGRSDPKHSPTQSNISAPPTFGDGGVPFRSAYDGALAHLSIGRKEVTEIGDFTAGHSVGHVDSILLLRASLEASR